MASILVALLVHLIEALPLSEAFVATLWKL